MTKFLDPLDSAFILLENPGTSMNIGAIVELGEGESQSEELEVSPQSREDEGVGRCGAVTRVVVSILAVSLGHAGVSSVGQSVGVGDADASGKRSYSVRSRGWVRVSPRVSSSLRAMSSATYSSRVRGVDRAARMRSTARCSRAPNDAACPRALSMSAVS